MVPLTPASELRDDPAWIEEMLPLFEESCMKDEGESLTCYAPSFLSFFLSFLSCSESIYPVLHLLCSHMTVIQSSREVTIETILTVASLHYDLLYYHSQTV